MRFTLPCVLAVSAGFAQPSLQGTSTDSRGAEMPQVRKLLTEQQRAFGQLTGTCRRAVRAATEKGVADSFDADVATLAAQFAQQHEANAKLLNGQPDSKALRGLPDGLWKQRSLARKCYELYHRVLDANTTDKLKRLELDGEVASRNAEFFAKNAELAVLVRKSLGGATRGRVIADGKIDRPPVEREPSPAEIARLEANKFGCQTNLMNLYQQLVVYKIRHGKLPEGGGAKVMFELWKSMEHTERNRDLFFCPAAAETEHIKKLKRMPVDSIWKKPEDFTSHDTHYAVATRLLMSGRTVWISDDNEGGCCHADGSLNVLLGDGRVKSIEISELVGRGLLPEKAPKGGYVVPVGKDSPVAELHKLRR